MIEKIINLLFRIFLCTIVLGQLGRISLPGGGEGALYLSDFVLVGLIMTWLFWRIVIIKKLFLTPIDLLILLFISVTFVSLILALNWAQPNQIIVASFYWVRLVAYLLVSRITLDLAKTRKFTKEIITLSTIFAVAGLMQFWFFPDFSKYVQHGWDPHYYRVLSTFFDPNYAGLFLTFGFLFTLNQIYPIKKSVTPRQLWLLTALTTIGVAMVLTFSRSTYLAFLIGLMVFAFFKDKRIIIATLILGLIVFISIPRVRTRVIGALNLDQTAKLRLVDYQKSWKIIEDNVLFGVGFNTLRYAKEEYGYFRNDRGVSQPSGHAGAGADNSLLFIWSTSGIVGLTAFLSVLGIMSYYMWRSKNRAVGLGLILAWLVHGQFVNSLFYTGLLGWAFVIIGIYLNPHEAQQLSAD